MKMTRKRGKGAESTQKKFCLGVMIVLLPFCFVNAAVAQVESPWQHEATIHGWYAGIDGSVHHPGAPGSGQDFAVDGVIRSKMAFDLGDVVAVDLPQLAYAVFDIVGDDADIRIAMVLVIQATAQ